MTPEEVRQRVDALRTAMEGTNSDPEDGHCKQDSIWLSALRAIASDEATDPRAVAAEAVKAHDIEFERWYA